ncbi:MAG TPA: hypothetical protein VGC44_13305 [Longimicrobiales bacterium]
MPLLDRQPAPIERLSARLTMFGVLYCAMHVGVTFLKIPLDPGFTVGDWLSLLTPFAVMGSALLVFDATYGYDGDQTAARRVLLASAAAYSTGLGINLAANAIARLYDQRSPQAYALTYFLDEHLGHVVWHLGMAGVTAALFLVSRALPPGRLGPATLIGALAYAFAWFTDGVEGQTVPLLLSASVLFLVVLLMHRVARRSLIGRFLLLGHGSALLLFAIWWVWQDGFPQFTEIWSL